MVLLYEKFGLVFKMSKSALTVIQLTGFDTTICDLSQNQKSMRASATV